MKPIISLLAALCLACCSFAQTDPVWLLDDNGFFLSTYKSIQSAYAAIPASLTHSYTIELQSNYDDSTESYPVIFTQKAGASASNKIRITGFYSPMKNFYIDSTDYFVFDGADWIEFDVTFHWYTGQRPAKNLFHFKNGATNNIIRGFYLQQGMGFSFTGNAGNYFYFGQSPNNIEGNSNNVIEHCTFYGTSGGCITSGGTTANPNRDNIIRNNNFAGYVDVMNFHSGTSGIIIDSNTITVLAKKYAAARGVVDLENVSGDISITRNTLIISQDSSDMAGIYIKATGANQCLLANNMIRYVADSYTLNRSVLLPYEDEATNLSGIWFDGTEQTVANVYHNTILVQGTYKASLGPATMTSSAFRRTESNAGSTYDIRNNIFMNHRTGGGSNAVHVALDLQKAGNLTLNYNFYTGSTGMALLNGTPYHTWTAYKTEAGKTNNNEVNSDSLQISFSGSNLSLHLASDMYGKTSAYGTAIPAVTTDIDGQLRTVYYRGADEYTISCPPMLAGGTINIGEADSCLGNYVRLGANNQTPAIDGVEYQWQTRAFGSGLAFTDIPGARSATKWATFMPINAGFTFVNTKAGAHEYRLKTSCISSGDSAFSNVVITYGKPAPRIDTIMASTPDGFDYTFRAIGDSAGHYWWNFGDSTDGSNDATVTHTYKDKGLRTVRLMVANYFFCSFDTFYRTIQVGVKVNDIDPLQHITLYPNPASEQITVALVDGTPYTITDLSGRTVSTGRLQSQTIAIKNLVAGTYIIHFTLQEHQRFYTRFVKE